MPDTSNGFSLLETLVAISIFSVISLAMFFTMEQYFSTGEVLNRRDAQFTSMNRFLHMIERDIHYAINRKVRDQYGDYQDAIVVGSVDGKELLSVTSSLPDYRGKGQSRLFRVSWSFHEDSIIRSNWRVLDRAQNSEPITHKILTGISDVRLAVTPDLEAFEEADNTHVDYHVELVVTPRNRCKY